MNGQSSIIIDAAKIFKDLISENIWAFALIFFLFIARKGIAEFIKRVVNFDLRLLPLLQWLWYN